MADEIINGLIERQVKARKASTVVYVKFQRVGFHRWKEAHERRFYLRELHRHVFHVEVMIEVEHDDREIEFHDLLEEAEGAFQTGDGSWSCERMARDLGTKLAVYYDRPVTVDVSEDGECGAVVVCEKEEAPVYAGALVGGGDIVG